MVRLETAPTSLGGKARCESRAFFVRKLSEPGFMGFSGLGVKSRESELQKIVLGIGLTKPSHKRVPSYRRGYGTRSVPTTFNMNLAPEQYFVYAWRYTDDAVCKLGVSTLRSFYARIKAAKTVTYQDIELPWDRGLWD